MSAGQSADEAMTQPRQAEIGLGVLQERVERGFASEFGERDTSLGADAEIFVRELSADLTGEHL